MWQEANQLTQHRANFLTSLANLASSALCSLTRRGKSSVMRMLEPRSSFAFRSTASLSWRLSSEYVRTYVGLKGNSGWFAIICTKFKLGHCISVSPAPAPPASWLSYQLHCFYKVIFTQNSVSGRCCTAAAVTAKLQVTTPCPK